MLKSSLVHQLAWEHDFEIDSKKAGPQSSPSWSWLSSFQPVRTNFIDKSPDPLSPELLSCSVQLADQSSPFGHVLGGELDLIATFTHSLIIPQATINKFDVVIDRSSWKSSDLPRISDTNEFLGEFYYYLYIGKANSTYSFGLLLQSMGDGMFIRKGLLHVSSKDAGASIWLSEQAQRMKLRLL